MSDVITVTEQPIQVTVTAGDVIQITEQPIEVIVSADGGVTVLEQPITVTVQEGDEVTVTETPVAVTVGGADHPSTHSLTGADHTLSGLTVGHVLTALGPTSAGFAAAAGGAAAIIVKEDNAVVSAGASIIDFTEPDATLLTVTGVAPTQEVDVNMALYSLLSGRSGGQTLLGGTGAGDNLTLQSTSHATRGDVVVNDRINHAVTNAGFGGYFLNYTTTSVGTGLEFTTTATGGTGASGISATVQLSGAAAGSNLSGIGIQLVTAAAQVNVPTTALGLNLSANYTGAKPTFSTGIEISDFGHASVGIATAIDIFEQTASTTATYNIRQRGTTGVNRLAAPTLVGADASPDAGVTLQVQMLEGATSILQVGAELVATSPVNATGFAFTASMFGIDLNGQGPNGWQGVFSGAPFNNNSATPVTLGAYWSFYSAPSIAGTVGVITAPDIIGYLAASPFLQNVTATLVRGVVISNQGDVGVTLPTSVALDIEAQTVSTDRYSFRVAGAARSVHLPSIAIGGGHALTVSPGATVDIDPINVTGVSTEQIGLLFQNRTIALSSGATVATMRHVQFFAPTINGIAGGGAETVTDAATVYIDNAPAGSNITLTRTHSLWVAAGRVLIGGELELDGALNHDGTTVGFYGVTPATRPSAYTQTYATADKTHSAFTSADLAAFTGGLVGFLDAAERDDIRTQFNALRADVADVKQLANSIIDDNQALGLFQ